jgi:hypothetical protein
MPNGARQRETIVCARSRGEGLLPRLHSCLSSIEEIEIEPDVREKLPCESSSDEEAATQLSPEAYAAPETAWQAV